MNIRYSLISSRCENGFVHMFDDPVYGPRTLPTIPFEDGDEHPLNLRLKAYTEYNEETLTNHPRLGCVKVSFEEERE